jgi:hypothetical protein
VYQLPVTLTVWLDRSMRIIPRGFDVSPEWISIVTVDTVVNAERYQNGDYFLQPVPDDEFQMT